MWEGRILFPMTTDPEVRDIRAELLQDGDTHLPRMGMANGTLCWTPRKTVYRQKV